MPRNTRLSSYYTLPTSFPTAKKDPLPRTREEALAHAQHQTQTLPLSTLLTTLTAHQKTTAELSNNLRESTLSHYKHLQTALKTAEKVSEHTKNLPTNLKQINEALQHTRAIVTRLTPAREAITALESVRKTELLISAMGLLTQAFARLSEELPLCTDPESVKKDVLLASERFACIRPALGRLAAVDKSLGSRVNQLDAAAECLSATLQGEQSVLQRGDIASVRLKLADERERVKNDFVQAVVGDVLHRTVSEQALGDKPLQRCLTRLQFFEQQVLGDFMQDVAEYERLFGECTWAEHVVLDALAEARGEVKNVVGERNDVVRVREVLNRLREKGARAKATTAAESVDGLLRDVAIKEGNKSMVELLQKIDEVDRGDIVSCVNDLRDGLEAVLNRYDATEAVTCALIIPQQMREITAAAVVSHVLLHHSWDLSKVRDMCVEQCVQAVLQNFCDYLQRDSLFTEDVRWVRELGNKFAVPGLVDDDLGEGFAYRIGRGVVQILRTMSLGHAEAERVSKMLKDIDDVLDLRRIEGAMKERLID